MLNPTTIKCLVASVVVEEPVTPRSYLRGGGFQIAIREVDCENSPYNTNINTFLVKENVKQAEIKWDVLFAQCGDECLPKSCVSKIAVNW